MQLFLLLIISVSASEEKKLNILENNKQNSRNNSHYFGVGYNKRYGTWVAQRRSKHEKKTVYNGTVYKDEETAARASDTLARKLIENGEKYHKLNFPDDNTEIYAETNRTNYLGVNFQKRGLTWSTSRWSKNEKKTVHNGTAYKSEETAAHASDTLARKLIANGEKGHKLNFPDHNIEEPEEKRYNCIGLNYNIQKEIWSAQRWSKNERTLLHNGTYKNKKTAAHASDTLARKLITKGEKGHKLNFPDDDTEVWAENQKNKRKRPADSKANQKCGKFLNKFE